MDKKFQIRLSATEDVKEFVRAAGQCDFDIDVFYNRVVIDAKSILGVLSLDLTQPLTVRISYRALTYIRFLTMHHLLLLERQSHRQIHYQ